MQIIFFPGKCNSSKKSSIPDAANGYFALLLERYTLFGEGQASVARWGSGNTSAFWRKMADPDIFLSGLRRAPPVSEKSYPIKLSLVTAGAGEGGKTTLVSAVNLARPTASAFQFIADGNSSSGKISTNTNFSLAHSKIYFHLLPFLVTGQMPAGRAGVLRCLPIIEISINFYIVFIIVIRRRSFLWFVCQIFRHPDLISYFYRLLNFALPRIRKFSIFVAYLLLFVFHFRASPAPALLFVPA